MNDEPNMNEQLGQAIIRAWEFVSAPGKTNGDVNLYIDKDDVCLELCWSQDRVKCPSCHNDKSGAYYAKNIKAESISELIAGVELWFKHGTEPDYTREFGPDKCKTTIA